MSRTEEVYHRGFRGGSIEAKPSVEPRFERIHVEPKLKIGSG